MAPRKVEGRRSSAAEALANAVRKHLDAAQQLSAHQDQQLKEKLQAEYAEKIAESFNSDHSANHRVSCDAMNRSAKSWSNQHSSKGHRSRDSKDGRFWASQVPIRQPRSRIDLAQTYPLVTHSIETGTVQTFPLHSSSRQTSIEQNLSDADEMVKTVKAHANKKVKAETRKKLTRTSSFAPTQERVLECDPDICAELNREFQIARQKALHLLRNTNCSSKYTTQFAEIGERLGHCLEIVVANKLNSISKCEFLSRVLLECKSQFQCGAAVSPEAEEESFNSIATPIGRNRRPTGIHHKHVSDREILTPLSESGSRRQVTRGTISQPSVELSYEESHPDHGNPMARLPHRTMRFPQNIMAVEKNARTQKLHRDGYLPGRALPPMPPPEVCNRIQNKKRGEWRMRLRAMSTPPTWEHNMGSFDAIEGMQAPAPKHRSTLIDTRMKFYDTKPDGWVNSRDAWQNQFYQHAGKTEVTDVALGW